MIFAFYTKIVISSLFIPVLISPALLPLSESLSSISEVIPK
jgi:hypothetical protein